MEEKCPYCLELYDEKCLVKNYIDKNHHLIKVICEDCFHHHLKNKFNLVKGIVD